MAGLLGIDISNNNPGVNMAQARAQGLDFVIAKCSQGWTGGPGGWMDWTWVDIVTRARAVGILPGGYHWMLKGNGAAQAQLFLQSLQRAGGPSGFLCAIDIEETEWNQSLNVDPETVDEFLAEWDALTGRHPLFLYGAGWYHDGYMHAGVRWPSRPLWVAQYNGVASGPIAAQASSVTPGYMTPFGGWTSYAIRQFTDNAIVGGVEVDANITYLSLDALTAMTQPPEPLTPDGDFTVDAAAKARFDAQDAKIDALTKTVQQLVTVIQGVPAGKPNPFNLVGTHDLDAKLDIIIAKEKVGA